MAEIPQLAGVATADLVEQIQGAGSFKASYINWARTVNLLREHAPGWQPDLVMNEHGSPIHRAPVGAYLLIRFQHQDGTVTPPVPQAIMDNKNKSIPLDKIDSRDLTDTHRRGVCLAAAFTFGLAYELWAKMPLESGFTENTDKSDDAPPPVSSEDAATLRDWIAQTDSDSEKFCAVFGVESVDAVPAAMFDKALALLKRKAKQAA